MTIATKKTVRSQRLQALPPYLFVEIDRKKRAKMAAGRDVIDLGIGDPDRPTPRFIIEAMEKAARDPVNHRYPIGSGIKTFREAAAKFMKKRFGVEADPARHITTCIGSKEGIAHLPLAVVDPEETVLVPGVHYPPYVAGATFAGAKIHFMPLTAANGWKPRFEDVPGDVASRAKLAWVNYPNNPTAASADIAFYERYVEFCGRHGIIAASDQAYSEIFFEERPLSLWQVRGASLETTLGIEFHSLSKTFNMTGWRLGFAVGHPEVVGALESLKGNIDSGQFNAIQAAGAVALDNVEHPDVVAMRGVYRERRDVLVPGLRAIGCQIDPPTAGFFAWARTPVGASGKPIPSMEFASRCLEEADLVVVPGAGFSKDATDYFRIALTVEVPRIREAMERLKKVDWKRG
jgi:LL-diaminopimelate aminotransferase